MVPDETEDSFLYVQSAENALKEGFREGFWFGKSEHFLFTFTLYLFTLVLRNGMLAGKTLSILCNAGTMIFIYDIGRKHLPQRALYIALSLIAFIGLGHIWYSTGILSESMFLLATAAAFWMYMEKKPGWALGLLLAVSFFIRVETGFLCIFFGVKSLFDGRWKTLPSLVIVSTAGLMLRLTHLHGETVGLVQETLGLRFGEAVGYHLILKYTEVGLEYSYKQLFGEIHLFWFLTKMLVAFWVVSEILEKPVKKIFTSLPFWLLLFVLLNIIGINIMKYYRLHPATHRHYSYIAPFLALFFGVVIHNFIILFENAFGKRIPAVIAGLSVIVALLLVGGSNPSSAKPQWGEGFFWKMRHYHDIHREVGQWLRENMNSGEGVIFSIPSDNYFSSLPESINIMPWPENRLDYDYYKHNGVRFVVWSNIQTDLDSIRSLSYSRDFLFFRHRLTPPPPAPTGWYGWKSIIYEIDQDFNEREYQIGEFGNGFMVTNPGLGMFMGARADLNILSSRKGIAEVRFYAKSYHINRHLRVILNDEIFSETPVSKSSGWGKENATEIVLKIPIEEGTTRIVLESLEPPTTPASIIGGTDSRLLAFYIHRDILIRMMDEYDSEEQTR